MGLESAEASVHGEKVNNYINLFQDVEACTRGGASAIILNIAMTISLLFGVLLVTQ